MTVFLVWDHRLQGNKLSLEKKKKERITGAKTTVSSLQDSLPVKGFGAFCQRPQCFQLPDTIKEQGEENECYE